MTMSTLDWTDVASSWDVRRGHVEKMKEPLTRALLASLDLHPGQRALELGAGTGELALRIAEQVGPRGSLIASDVAPGMVELIGRTVAAVSNVEVVQLDARAIHLPDASVDAVVFRMGLMLVDEPARVLSECHRVLAPGGRLALAVWAGPEHNPWLTCIGMAAMMHGLVSGGPPTGPGGPFSLADPHALEQLLRDAGFDDVIVRAVETPSTFASADEHFETVIALAPPLAAALAGAPEVTRAAVRKTAADLIERYRSDDGFVLPGRALLCSARSSVGTGDPG
jgi:SAM-dependent methyltransferase